MYFRNILVPYDESEHAKSALHIALGLAGPYPEARVSVLTVIASAALPNPTLLGDGGIGTPYAIADPATYERLMDSVVKNACARSSTSRLTAPSARSWRTRSSPTPRSRASRST